MNEPALCQCRTCHLYLSRNRTPSDNYCEKCEADGGIPLAKIRGTLSEALSLELLALLTEECGEVSQRIGKIIRWGWEADFEGTTQQHKLESELGDIFAAVVLMFHNGLLIRDNVEASMDSKLRKFREDAAGPRQRLLHAKVPAENEV